MKSTPRLARRAARRRALSICALFTGTLLASACYSVRVQTLGAPQANFTQYRTFRILETPVKLDQLPPSSASNEPMLNNSITYQAGREYVRQALMARGFVEDNKNPDFNVAFYAQARERLNITDWGYGYGYGCCGYNNITVTEYTEGTVIVDLVDPDNNKLVWRGSGVADVSDNPRKYLRDLQRIVPKIVNKIPVAYPEAIVAQSGGQQ